MNFSYIVPSPFITLLKLSAQHSWRHGGHVAQTNFMRYCSGSFHCSQITLGLFFKASPATHLFIWKLVFICMWIKTNFHMKGWAPRLALKKRPKVIRKWSIDYMAYWHEVYTGFPRFFLRMSNTLEEASSWSFFPKPFDYTKKIKASRAIYAVKKKIQRGTILMRFEFRLCHNNLVTLIENDHPNDWVQRRTAVGDWRFDNECGSHLQSFRVKPSSESRVITVLWLSFIHELGVSAWGGAPSYGTLKSSCALSLWATVNPAQ